MELTSEYFRAMIYYDFGRRLSKQECIDQLISTFGDGASSYATVKRWYNEFNRGRHSLTHEFRKGRSKSAVGPENINVVQKLIMQNRHVTYCEIEVRFVLVGWHIIRQKLKKIQESIGEQKCTRNTMPVLKKTCIRL